MPSALSSQARWTDLFARSAWGVVFGMDRYHGPGNPDPCAARGLRGVTADPALEPGILSPLARAAPSPGKVDHRVDPLDRCGTDRGRDTSRSRRPSATACARSRAPSLRYRLAACDFTVSSEMPSVSAMSRLDRPWLMPCRTARWMRVSAGAEEVPRRAPADALGRYLAGIQAP